MPPARTITWPTGAEMSAVYNPPSGPASMASSTPGTAAEAARNPAREYRGGPDVASSCRLLRYQNQPRGSTL